MKTLEEYTAEVKRHFRGSEPHLTEKDVNDYFEEEETKKYLKEEYESYKEKASYGNNPPEWLVGGDPGAVASTLSLMY